MNESSPDTSSSEATISIFLNRSDLLQNIPNSTNDPGLYKKMIIRDEILAISSSNTRRSG